MIDDHVTTMRFATRAELLVPFDRQTRPGEDVSPDVLYSDVGKACRVKLRIVKLLLLNIRGL